MLLDYEFHNLGAWAICSIGVYACQITYDAKNVLYKSAMPKEKPLTPPKRWLRSDDTVVACTEKVKVLEENWNEIRTTLQEALDDAVLMGCSEERVKDEFIRLVKGLTSQYEDAVKTQELDKKTDS